MSGSKSLFKQEHHQYFPTDLATGPWFEGSQHGSSMMALAAHAAQTYPCDYPFQVTRLTVDMIRAAPMSPTEIEYTVRSSGKNLNIIDFSIISEGREYVRGTALRSRIRNIEAPDELKDGHEAPSIPGDSGNPPFEKDIYDRPGFHHAIDVRYDLETGPEGVLWMRFTPQVIEGIETTPLARAAMAADWTYTNVNIGNRIRARQEGKPFEQSFFSINADATINLNREPAGEWIGIQGAPLYDDFGAGVAVARLLDEKGSFGISTQNLVVRSPQNAPMHQRDNK